MLNVVVHSELTSSVSAWSASLGQRSVSAVECFIVSCWAFLPSFMWQLSKFYTLPRYSSNVYWSLHVQA